MKKPTLTIVLFTCLAQAQAQSSELEQQIRELEQREYQAMLRHDAATLQQLWSPAFTVNAPFNRITPNAAAVIAMVSNGTIRYTSFTRTIEQVVQKQGVVITMGSEEVVPTGTNPRAGQTVRRRFTNIWMQEDGQWRMVARHANEICAQ